MSRKESTKTHTVIRLLSRYRIDPVKGCWLWQGARMSNGYGVIGMFIGGRKGNRLVHRAAVWAMEDFDIFSELCVLHHCDVRHCFNPSHLFIGTQLENMEDAWQKGRLNNAMQRHPHKLTPSKVREIRKTYAGGGYTNRSLATKLDLGKSTIQAIVGRKIWTHV